MARCPPPILRFPAKKCLPTLDNRRINLHARSFFLQSENRLAPANSFSCAIGNRKQFSASGGNRPPKTIFEYLGPERKSEKRFRKRGAKDEIKPKNSRIPYIRGMKRSGAPWGAQAEKGCCPLLPDFPDELNFRYTHRR